MCQFSLIMRFYFERPHRKRRCLWASSGRDGRLRPASSERAAEDVDPAAGTSSGQDACVQSAAPRPVAPHLRPSAPMKPPLMKPRAAKVRRKVAGDREHVLARRVCLDAVVCGWSWPEPELLLRPAGLRWAALVLWVHHRLPTAGLRRDHVSSWLGLVVAEDAVSDRRGSARGRRVSAARAAGHQVPTTQREGGRWRCRRRRRCRADRGPGGPSDDLIPIIQSTSLLYFLRGGVWYYLISSGWAGWERSQRRIRNREWVDCDVTDPLNPLKPPPHKHIGTFYTFIGLLLQINDERATSGKASRLLFRTRSSTKKKKTIPKRCVILDVCLSEMFFCLFSRRFDVTDCDTGSLWCVFKDKETGCVCSTQIRSGVRFQSMKHCSCGKTLPCFVFFTFKPRDVGWL